MSINLIDLYWETDQFRAFTAGLKRNPVIEAIRGKETFIHGRSEDDGSRWQLFILPMKEKAAFYRMDVYDPDDRPKEVHHFLVGKGVDVQLLDYLGKVSECKQYDMQKQLMAVDTYMAGGAARNHRITFTRDELGTPLPKLETFYYNGTNERIREHEIHYKNGHRQFEYFFDRGGKYMTRALFYNETKEGSVLHHEQVLGENGNVKELIYYHPDGKTVKEHQYFVGDKRLRDIHYREDGTREKVTSYRNGQKVHEAGYEADGTSLDYEHLYQKGAVYATHGYYDGDRDKVRYNVLYRPRHDDDPAWRGKGDPTGYMAIAYKIINYDRDGEITHLRDYVLNPKEPHERPKDYSAYEIANEWRFSRTEGDSFWSDGRLSGYRGQLFFRPEVDGGTLYYERLFQKGLFRDLEPSEERSYDREERMHERTGYYTNGNKKLDMRYTTKETPDGVVVIPVSMKVYDRNDSDIVIYECTYDDGLKSEETYHAPHDVGVTAIHKSYEDGVLASATITYDDGVDEVLTYQRDMQDGKPIPLLVKQEYVRDDKVFESYDHPVLEDIHIIDDAAPKDFFTKRHDKVEKQQALFRAPMRLQVVGLDDGTTYDTKDGIQGYTGHVGIALAGDKRELALAKKRLELKYPDLTITIERRKYLQDFPDVYLPRGMKESSLPMAESDVLIVTRDYKQRGFWQSYPHAVEMTDVSAYDSRGMDREHAQMRKELTDLLLDVRAYTDCDIGVSAVMPSWSGEPVMAVCTVRDRLPIVRMGIVPNAVEMGANDFTAPVLAAAEAILRRNLRDTPYITIVPDGDGRTDQLHITDTRTAESQVKDGLSVEDRKERLVARINAILIPPRTIHRG
ncbi:MAG: hypothetical protein EB060_06840 [Proteobacteria bacterium]|nr:hypothetical protein [Pseudomonadota bacterium]